MTTDTNALAYCATLLITLQYGLFTLYIRALFFKTKCTCNKFYGGIELRHSAAIRSKKVIEDRAS